MHSHTAVSDTKQDQAVDTEQQNFCSNVMLGVHKTEIYHQPYCRILFQVFSVLCPNTQELLEQVLQEYRNTVLKMNRLLGRKTSRLSNILDEIL